VRNVCISHQSVWIYYKQPIKFLVVKVNGMWEDLIRIEFRTRKYFSFYKRWRSIHILCLHRHFLWVRLRILFTDEMSLEVWNSTWASCMQMKRNTFIFRSRSFGVIRIRSVIQDQSGILDHGTSKEPVNPWPEWIHRFLWCTWSRQILDHWAGSG